MLRKRLVTSLAASLADSLVLSPSHRPMPTGSRIDVYKQIPVRAPPSAPTLPHRRLPSDTLSPPSQPLSTILRQRPLASRGVRASRVPLEQRRQQRHSCQLRPGEHRVYPLPPRVSAGRFPLQLAWGCLLLAPPALWDAWLASGGGFELRMGTAGIGCVGGIVVRVAGVRVVALLTVIVSACVICVPLLAL